MLKVPEMNQVHIKHQSYSLEVPIRLGIVDKAWGLSRSGIDIAYRFDIRQKYRIRSGKYSVGTAMLDVVTLKLQQPHLLLLDQCFWKGVSAVREPGVRTNRLTATSPFINGQERLYASGLWPVGYSERLEISSSLLAQPRLKYPQFFKQKNYLACQNFTTAQLL